jgi:hypothetical protein
MSVSTASETSRPPHEPPPGPPAPPGVSRSVGVWVGRAFFLAVIAGIVFAAYRIVTSERDPGPFAVGEIVTGALQKYGDTPDVPGRPLGVFESAHVWTVLLERAKPYTIFVCSQDPAGKPKLTANFVVHGPAGRDDNLHGHDEVGHLGRLDKARLTYTPTSAGPHTVYVYKTRQSPNGRYGMTVVEGEVEEPPPGLCHL